MSGLERPSLTINTVWGSEHYKHRLKIRRYIKHQYSVGGETLNLDKLPSLEEGYVSISHCPGMGGVAYGKTPLGFDIEVLERISRETVLNLCSLEEFAEAPSVEALWVAKEAIYKSLWHFEQPQAISELTVGWGKLGKERGSRFYLKNSSRFGCSSGRGWLSIKKNLIYALFTTEEKLHSLPV